MTSVSRAVDTISLLTGASSEDLRARARYLRKAGMLSSGPKGRGAPEATERDVAVLLLATMCGGSQVDCPVTVARTLSLRHKTGYQTETIGTGKDGSIITAQRFLGEVSDGGDLGTVLETAITSAHIAGNRQNILSAFKSLNVWHGGNAAMIESADNKRHFFNPPNNDQGIAPIAALVPLSTMVSIDRAIIAHLSDLTKPNQRSLPLEKTNAQPAGTDRALDNSVTPNLDANLDQPHEQSESATTRRLGQGEPTTTDKRNALGEAEHGRVVRLEPKTQESPDDPRQTQPFRAAFGP